MFRTGVLLATLAAALLTGCKRAETREDQRPVAAVKVASNVSQNDACSSAADGEQLKALLFQEAKQVRTGKPEMLDQLAGAVGVRVEELSFRNRDEALDATICKGRLVLDLPPGTKDPFNASRRLEAEIAFAVQGPARKDRPVYLIGGAEPIIYRLAAIEPEQAASSAPVQPVPPAAQEARTVPVARKVLAVRMEEPMAWQSAEPRRPGRGRPSFDCRFARSRSQRMICADERLAAYDRVMAPLYEDAVERSKRRTQERLRVSQARFEALRDDCDGPACIAEAYQERMNEIDSIVATR